MPTHQHTTPIKETKYVSKKKKKKKKKKDKKKKIEDAKCLTQSLYGGEAEKEPEKDDIYQSVESKNEFSVFWFNHEVLLPFVQ
ncbi:hypothetical protein HmCmsJML033_02517 [Escherichia coli]|nr:hypothetical protein HmCmsJML033_02517 [Escherichia coli]